MKKNFIFVSILIMMPLFCAGAANAADKNGDNAEMEQMRKAIEQLQEKVDKLEKKSDVSVPPEEKEGETFADKEEPVLLSKESKLQIEYRESFSDKQEAAPRPYDLTLDPDYRGFIPIPHTHGMIRFNARPRVDMTNDNNFAGNENRFTTANIPVAGEINHGGGYQFNMNAQGTQLSMDVRGPRTTGNPRFYYENDFAAAGTQYLNYRVRHLYGEMFNIVLGQTYTIFEDADAWPDTVDYEGPNAAISARRPLVRYMIMLDDNWGISFALEKPDAQVDTTGDATATSEIHAPDGGFHIKWAKKGVGHVQLATIFRDIGVSGTTVGEHSVFGWGVSLSSNLNLFKNDSFQTQLTYGEGIFYFMNDAVENADAAFNAAGNLRPLPVVALMGGYTHSWSKKFRSTGSFGFVNVDNQISQAGNAYHRTYYASLNLVYQWFKRLGIGVEGLYGYKQEKSLVSGQVFRAQATVMYALFR